MTEEVKAAPLPELEIEFSEPIEFAGKSYNSIVLREPKAREVQQALAILGSAASPELMYRYHTSLIASVSGVQRQVVEQMSVRQFNQAARYVDSFLE